MWPVRVILRASGAPTEALARSKILMTRSAPPVANMSLVGSKAMDRTHPRCDDRTVVRRHGACHFGVGILVASADDFARMPPGRTVPDASPPSSAAPTAWTFCPGRARTPPPAAAAVPAAAAPPPVPAMPKSTSLCRTICPATPPPAPAPTPASVPAASPRTMRRAVSCRSSASTWAVRLVLALPPLLFPPPPSSSSPAAAAPSEGTTG
mmetsp:Transcript_2877/g.6617  ORF Transcript_2877/g.6617 Transcript_2877/m.6617 type:complete len:209 (+) Transcript_2877:894-1520(+)